MKGKRLLAGFLAAAMTIFSLPNIAIAATGDKGSYNDFEYEEMSDGTLCINNYSGDEVNVNVPAVIDGKTVTEIDYLAFSKCENIVSLTIPETVTKYFAPFIDPKKPNVYAIRPILSCPYLKEISVSGDNPIFASVDGVLYNKDKTELLFCPEGRTKKLVIPDGVTTIKRSSFDNCNKLPSVVMPDTVTEIELYAFYKCSSLVNIKFSENLEKIGNLAFTYCDSLKSIILPKSIEEIGDCFEYCSNLQYIVVPPETKYISKYAFTHYPNIVGYSGTYAETYANQIEKKFIPMDSTFSDSNTGITVLGSSSSSKDAAGIEIENFICRENSLSFDLYYKNEAGQKIQPSGDVFVSVPLPYGWSSEDNMLIKVKNDDSNSTALDYEIVDDNFLISADSFGHFFVNVCFYSGDYMYIFPDDSSIEIEKYNGEESKLDVPSEMDGYTVTSIGDLAFANRVWLSSISIPDSVISIGDMAFYNCKDLMTVIMSDSVTNIGKDSFSECFRMEDVYFYGTESEWNALDIASGNDLLLNSEIHYIVKHTHSPADAVIEKSVEPTCVDSGSYDKVVYCSDCGAEISRETVTVPATGIHTPSDAVVENYIPATEKSDGSYDEVVYCSVCHEEISRKTVIIPAIVVSLIGDVNKSGAVDLVDEIALARWLAGWNVEIDESAADVDGSGGIDLLDDITLARRLAGWNV